MLFSATQTTKVADLARISLRPGPVHIDVDKEEATSTVSTLSQGYVVCPSDRRFLLLFTFLKKNLKKKVMVFFSSCNSVKYHGELLNYIDVPVLDLHVRTSLIFRPQKLSNSFYSPRASKNNKNALILFLNSSTPNRASSFVLMLPLVDLTFPAWTGSSSSTRQMIRAIISIASVVQLAPGKLERACCSCWKANLDFYGI
jgi:Superfamily II DNA and RNA helicases